jgi:hypothetical protein
MAFCWVWCVVCSLSLPQKKVAVPTRDTTTYSFSPLASAVPLASLSTDPLSDCTGGLPASRNLHLPIQSLERIEGVLGVRPLELAPFPRLLDLRPDPVSIRHLLSNVWVGRHAPLQALHPTLMDDDADLRKHVDPRPPLSQRRLSLGRVDSLHERLDARDDGQGAVEEELLGGLPDFPRIIAELLGLLGARHLAPDPVAGKDPLQPRLVGGGEIDSEPLPLDLHSCLSEFGLNHIDLLCFHHWFVHG